MVINGAPDSEEAYAILKDMDFGLYYDQKVGLLYGGYSPKPTSKDCDKKGPQLALRWAASRRRTILNHGVRSRIPAIGRK